MEPFFQWFSRRKWEPSEPWLVLGKGPSFSRIRDLDVSGYRKLSLNHSVRELPVDVAHVIDFDVIASLGDALERNAGVLVMPWRPHVGHRPSPRPLPELVETSPALRSLDAQGRLLWYNLATAPEPHPESPEIVPVRFFSAEAAVNLLAQAGVRTIRTLGVDGGAAYSGRFEDLKGKTLLANGRASFDEQFGELAKSVRRWGLDFGPLGEPLPVKVFVGATEEQDVATAVLAHSIRRHASLSVEVTPLYRVSGEIPEPRDPARRPRTPFTFQRFTIPKAAGYRDRAIYLDSDMLVFRDIRELWMLPFDGADVLAVGDTRQRDRRPQFSVMLLDCGRLRWDIGEIVARLDSGELDYASLVHDMALASRVSAAIPPEWNSLERFDRGRTALLHYTDMHRQPWVYSDNPLGKLWCRALLDAIRDGDIDEGLVRLHIRRGWVRPSLSYQIEKGIEDPLRLPWKARRLDAAFVPPYCRHTGAEPPSVRWRGLRWLRARVSSALSTR